MPGNIWNQYGWGLFGGGVQNNASATPTFNSTVPTNSTVPVFTHNPIYISIDIYVLLGIIVAILIVIFSTAIVLHYSAKYIIKNCCPNCGSEKVYADNFVSFDGKTYLICSACSHKWEKK